MKPALTAEEWADAATEGEWYGPTAPLLIETEPNGLTIRRVDELSDMKDPEINGDDLIPAIALANAALARCGQPFGFTWEDVDALHDEYRAEWEGSTGGAWLLALADRIAALLPPREEP